MSQVWRIYASRKNWQLLLLTFWNSWATTKNSSYPTGKTNWREQIKRAHEQGESLRMHERQRSLAIPILHWRLQITPVLTSICLEPHRELTEKSRTAQLNPVNPQIHETHWMVAVLSHHIWDGLSSNAKGKTKTKTKNLNMKTILSKYFVEHSLIH